jgi:hypothetical protein
MTKLSDVHITRWGESGTRLGLVHGVFRVQKFP